MSNLRKWLVVVLSVMVTVLCGVAITACNTNTDWRVPKGGLAADSGYVAPPEKTDDHFYHEGENPNDFVNSDGGYVVKTVSLGGMPVSNVTVRVINPGTGITLIEGLTQNGEVRFNIEPGAYKLEYDLPEGYSESEDTVHALSADKLSVTTVFSSSVIKSTVPDDHLYSLGEVMYDFEVSNLDGATRKLSDLLLTKKVVIINFFFTSCSPCRAEFPALEQAYELYKEDVEVVALADSGKDSAASVKGFQGTFQAESADSINPIRLTFFMALDSINLHNRFGVNAFPTTIVVDRYGVIADAHENSQPSTEWWKALFKLYCSDDYQQNIVSDVGGNEEQEPVAPGADIDPMPEDQNLLKEALLHESMKDNPHYNDIKIYGPDKGSRDEKYNWPYHIAQDEEGSKYLTPANLTVNNSWAIVKTDITLEKNETLSIEVNYNTEENGDLLYIILNQSNELYHVLSGNSGGWQEITLYSSTRRTSVNISITFSKNLQLTVEDEFLGLRNLRIEKLDLNSKDALDIRTDAASKNEDDSISFEDVYLQSEGDGFYHVQVGDVPQDNDPILFTDIMETSFYMEQHLKGYTLYNDSAVALPLSIYNLCYWRFNDYTKNEVFIKLTDDDTLDKKYTDIIIDSFYIQDGSEATVPVTEDLKEVLKAFVKAISDGSKLNFQDTAQVTNDTWLELCHYFSMEGQGDHTAKDHVCRATTNIGAGRTMTYAIELKEGKREIDTTQATRKNHAGGLFYKFTAPKAGVYSFKSIGERDPNGPDPMILMWKEDADVYGSDYIENDDSLSVEDALINPTTNFCLMFYLEEGETICPQLTTQSTEIVGKYEIEIKYEGESHYELEVATTGGGLWTYDRSNNVYYMAVEAGRNTYDGKYYNINDGQYCSPMYIDFIHRNFFDQNQNSLKDMIDHGEFDLANKGSGNFTGKMNEYYLNATSKDKDDPTYGMIEADDDLVKILSVFAQIIQDDQGSDVKSRIWESFACYYHYYGADTWVDME